VSEAFLSDIQTLRKRAREHIAAGAVTPGYAAEFLQHATDEQLHADQIAERITQLGGEPDFSPEGLTGRSHAEYVEGDSLEEMIKEDLVAERIAIDSYRAIVEYLGTKDPTTRRLMEEILAKEEEHADDLVTVLGSLAR
jgi:bacterioferritin